MSSAITLISVQATRKFLLRFSARSRYVLGARGRPERRESMELLIQLLQQLAKGIWA